MRRRSKKPQDLPVELELLNIESMDLDAQGIAHRSDGKVVFVDGALPFERVEVVMQKSKKSFDIAKIVQILRESTQRVKPRCAHFGLHLGACGGCKMQHLHTNAQIAIKQRVLEDNLMHIGKVKPENMLPAITGPQWSYRYRARLSIRYVKKRSEVLIGFHERKSHFVADMKECPILGKEVESLLLPLRKLIASLSNPLAIPQIELALGNGDASMMVIALVLRHLEPLSDADIEELQQFAKMHQGVQWWLQPNGPDNITRLVELPDYETPTLSYRLDDFGLQMPFRPTDFTQVNPFINQVLVARAMRLLQLSTTERVIDWFCGLGNFTLPIATLAGSVLGIEGADSLVARARQNYSCNKERRAEMGYSLAPVAFEVRNLFEMTSDVLARDGMADKWLIDPPREGAQKLCESLVQLRQINPSWKAPKRIVYVSCSPATLARDAGILVWQAGYRLVESGVVNMFAHTSHVESVAVFERG